MNDVRTLWPFINFILSLKILYEIFHDADSSFIFYQGLEDAVLELWVTMFHLRDGLNTPDKHTLLI